MQQLPLFNPPNLVIKRDTKKLYIVRNICGDVYECISFPRSFTEEVCDISYFLEEKDLEYVDRSS